jgi:hypothetical protein
LPPEELPRALQLAPELHETCLVIFNCNHNYQLSIVNYQLEENFCLYDSVFTYRPETSS